MDTPNPLPQPGTWAVTLDGSQYQIVYHCGPEGIGCSWGCADEVGCYVYSVDDDERYFYPWAELAGIGTADEAMEIAEAIP